MPFRVPVIKTTSFSVIAGVRHAKSDVISERLDGAERTSIHRKRSLVSQRQGHSKRGLYLPFDCNNQAHQVQRIENRAGAQESRARDFKGLPIRWQFAIDPIDGAVNRGKDVFWVIHVLTRSCSRSRETVATLGCRQSEILRWIHQQSVSR